MDAIEARGLVKTYSMYSTKLYDLGKRVQNMTKARNDASDMMEKAM